MRVASEGVQCVPRPCVHGHSLATSVGERFTGSAACEEAELLVETKANVVSGWARLNVRRLAKLRVHWCFVLALIVVSRHLNWRLPTVMHSCWPPGDHKSFSGHNYTEKSQVLTAGGKPTTTVLLGVTFNPTSAMLKRFIRYARDLTHVARFVLVVDLNCRLSVKPSVREQWLSLTKSNLIDIDICEFSEDRALSKFPAFAQLKNTAAKGYTSVTAWYMPITIIECVKTVFGEAEVDYFWVLTDDVGYSGNISDLVLWYAHDTADLIQGVGSSLLTNAPWPHHGAQSKAFRYKIGANYWGQLDNTQRWSKATFLMASRALEQGIVGTGEAWLPSLAAVEHLTAKRIDARFIGPKFEYNQRVTRSEWSQIRQMNESKLYHALKF